MNDWRFFCEQTPFLRSNEIFREQNYEHTTFKFNEKNNDLRTNNYTEQTILLNDHIYSEKMNKMDGKWTILLNTKEIKFFK